MDDINRIFSSDFSFDLTSPINHKLTQKTTGKVWQTKEKRKMKHFLPWLLMVPHQITRRFYLLSIGLLTARRFFFSIYCFFCWFVALLWSHDKVISSIPIILLNWFCSFCLNSLFILLSIVFKHKTFLFWTFKAKRQFWFDSPIFRLLIYLSFFTSLWILKNDAKMHLKLWIIHINIQYALNGHCHLHTTLTSRQIKKFRCEKQREKVVSFSLYLERKKNYY